MKPPPEKSIQSTTNNLKRYTALPGGLYCAARHGEQRVLGGDPLSGLGGDAPLTAEELPHLRPLYKDFMYWSRDLHLLRVRWRSRPNINWWAHFRPSPTSLPLLRRLE